MKDNKHKPFTAKRWTEVPKAFPTGETIEFTAEEKEKNAKDMERIMKEYGALKENEHIKGGKIVR